MRLGALEAGGTKMVCAIGNENGEIFERISIPTETPEITLPKLIEYFKDKEIEALGIGCFGPIDVNRNSETYGYITTTPKLAWANCDIVGAFKKALNIPVGFDTDVNGSALGEATWGITKGLENSVYRNRCRYGYYEQRKTASWYAASGSRTYPDEKTSGRSLRRQMPISQNLSGRSGCRPGDRSTLGQKRNRTGR